MVFPPRAQNIPCLRVKPPWGPAGEAWDNTLQQARRTGASGSRGKWPWGRSHRDDDRANVSCPSDPPSPPLPRLGASLLYCRIPYISDKTTDTPRGFWSAAKKARINRERVRPYSVHTWRQSDNISQKMARFPAETKLELPVLLSRLSSLRGSCTDWVLTHE